MTGTEPRDRPTAAPSRPAPRSAPIPGPGTGPGTDPAPGRAAERLAGLLAEESPEELPPTPDHRWATSARTRVPPTVLLLALTALGVLAWVLLGPDDPAGQARPAGTVPALAEVDAGSPRPTAPEGGSAPPPDGATSPGLLPGAPASAAARLLVHVAGEVARPGVVQLAPGARVTDAVEAAGGLTDAAVTDGVNLAAPVTDGQQVLVPDAGAVPPAVPAPDGTAAAAPAGGAPAGAPLNLNTATAADLEALPRVGPVLAERIVAFREANGGFAATGDLDAVEGIGPALMEALAPLVTV